MLKWKTAEEAGAHAAAGRFTCSRTVRRFTVFAIVAIFSIGLTACGGGDGDGAQETVTVVAGGGGDAAQETVTVVQTNETVADEGQATGPESGGIEVPDVVGMDHQLAQDTMQSAGLYNLSEEDATGQDRLLLFDRNWVVVEQIPAAGSMVSEDQTIVLRSKKVGE